MTKASAISQLKRLRNAIAYNVLDTTIELISVEALDIAIDALEE